MNKLYILCTSIIILVIIYITNNNEHFDSNTVYQIISVNKKNNPTMVSELDNFNFDNNIVNITNTITPNITIEGPDKDNFPSVISYNIEGNNEGIIMYNNKNYSVVLLKLELKSGDIVRVNAFDNLNPILPIPTEIPRIIQKDMKLLREIQQKQEEKIKEAQQIQQDLLELQSQHSKQSQLVQKDIEYLQKQANNAQRMQTDIQTQAKKYIYSANYKRNDNQPLTIDTPYIL